MQSKVHLFSPLSGYKYKQNSSRVPQGKKTLPGTDPLALSQCISEPTALHRDTPKAGKMLKGSSLSLSLSLSALQPPSCKASKWSSNWHLTSKGNLLSPVKHAGTLFGSDGRGKKWPVKSGRLLLLFTRLKTTSHTHTHTHLSWLLYWSWVKIAQ